MYLCTWKKNYLCRSLRLSMSPQVICLNTWSLFDSSCFETMQPIGGDVLMKKVSFWVGHKFYGPDAILSTICVLSLKSKERRPSHTLLPPQSHLLPCLPLHDGLYPLKLWNQMSSSSLNQLLISCLIPTMRKVTASTHKWKSHHLIICLNKQNYWKKVMTVYFHSTT